MRKFEKLMTAEFEDGQTMYVSEIPELGIFRLGGNQDYPSEKFLKITHEPELLIQIGRNPNSRVGEVKSCWAIPLEKIVMFASRKQTGLKRWSEYETGGVYYIRESLTELYGESLCLFLGSFDELLPDYRFFFEK